MRVLKLLSVALVALMTVQLAAWGAAAAQEKPIVKIPQPGVPQVMTIEGTWVRAAYNNEGYAIIGYHIANMSVGEEWMLLDFGTTLRDGVGSQKLVRESISLEMPDGKTIPMADNQAYRAANLSALQNRARVTRDSINYFPPGATRACRIGFFAELGQRAMSYDEVELSTQRACLGQLFFQVPGGIKYGQHWLNVKLKDSLVRVPFRILTKEEEKLLNKNYGDIRKQVQDAFKPPKKN